MGKFSGKFVIMLDDWLEVFPDQWPISATNSSLAAIRKVGQISGGNPQTVPRSSYVAQLIENKFVINNQNGKTLAGGIYNLTSAKGGT